MGRCIWLTIVETIHELQKSIEEIEYYRHPLPILYWASRGWRISDFSGPSVLRIVKTHIRDEVSSKWLMFLLLPLILFLVGKMFFYFNYQRLSLLVIYYSSIILIIILIFYVFYILPISINKIAKQYDDELKQEVEALITKIKHYIKENKLDPKKYPLKLRHNDYEGLTYEKLGKNKYISYVVLK